MPFIGLLQYIQVLLTVKSGQIFLFSFNRRNELDGGEVKKFVGIDKIVGQFEPDDPKGMDRPVIIIEIRIGIDESCLHKNESTSLHQLVDRNCTKTVTPLYLDIKLFSRLLSKMFIEQILNKPKIFF